MQNNDTPVYTEHNFKVLNAHVDGELSRTKQFQKYDNSLVWWSRSKSIALIILICAIALFFIASAYHYYKESHKAWLIEDEVSIILAQQQQEHDILVKNLNNDIITLNNDIIELQEKLKKLSSNIEEENIKNARERRDTIKKNNISSTSASRFEISQFVLTPFNKDGILNVITGKQYANEKIYTPTSQWCYIDKTVNNEKSSRKFTLALKSEDGTIIDGDLINLKVLNELQTTQNVLFQARQNCKFQ